MKKIALLLVLFATIIFGCATSKSLAKKALSLENSGQYLAASELYFQSILKNPNNVDALSGMKRTGSKVLDDHLSKFSKAKLDDNYKAAVYAYLDAEAYQNRIKGVNVSLAIPEFTTEDYKAVKDAYLEQEYEAGLQKIESESFSEAETKFNEIYKFDPNYKDVKELRNIAYLEPYYRKAETFKDNQEYRKAYQAYETILKRVPNYKETKSHRDYVLEKGRINIVFMDSDKKTKFQSYNRNVKTYAINAIINMKDPFIHVVDRENMDKIIKEQELAVSGLVNESEALEVGELSGAQYAIMLETTNYSLKETPIKSTRVNGFEQYREKTINKETQQPEYHTKYKSVNYNVFQGSRTVYITTHFKLLSLKTGQILSSKIIEKNVSSEVDYLTYDGNINMLYPLSDGKVNTASEAHNKLVEKSNGKRELQSAEVLSTEAYKQISNDIKTITFDQLSNL
ncbi:MAG: hypothetical protein JXR60_02410 [Bacteroidales bacterium]|nr:hypothetical protein [Bacteroidales bacterium]